MKNFIHSVNTLVLVILLTIYLLVNMSPYESREEIQEPAGEQSWIEKIHYHIDSSRHTVASYIQNEQSRIVTTYISQLKILAVGLLGLNILMWAASSLVPRNKQDKISLKVDGGTVSVTIRALEESLVRMLRGEAYVKDAKVVVQSEASRVCAKAYLTLIENANLHSLEEKILERMRQHFGAVFRVNRPVEYEVIINKLRPSSLPLHVPQEPAVSVEEKKDSQADSALIEKPRYPDNKI